MVTQSHRVQNVNWNFETLIQNVNPRVVQEYISEEC